VKDDNNIATVQFTIKHFNFSTSLHYLVKWRFTAGHRTTKYAMGQYCATRNTQWLLSPQIWN